LSSKKEKLETAEEEITDDEITKPEEKAIMNLSFGQLVKIGLSQNHFRSALLFFVFIFWIYQQLQDIGISVEDRLENVQWEGLHPNVYIIFTLVILYFALIIVISVVRTVLLFFDLEFKRIQSGFKVVSGLLNRKQFSALDRKIQMIKWSDNPLKRLLGIFDLQLKQASSAEVSSKKSLRIPGCSIENVEEVHHFLYPSINMVRIERVRVDYSYFWRNTLFTGLIPTLIIFSVLYYFDQKIIAYWSLLLLVYSAITTYIAYRKWSIFLHPEMIRIKQGVFGNKYEEVALFKIQNITVNQNLFQQRKSLANLVLHTASGSMRIPYIDLEWAKELRDYILYKVEKDERKWM
jgi:putative membrane protein